MSKHSDNDKKYLDKKKFKTVDGFFKGSKMFNLFKGKDVITKIKGTGKVHIIDKAIAKIPIARFDTPHPQFGMNYNHININPKFSGLAKDPHLKLPPGGLQATEATVRVCQVVNKANKVLIPIAIALDSIQILLSAITSIKNKSSRNVVETSVKVGSGWAGATGGASLGTLALPGLGTIAGALVGAIGGAIGISLTASAAVNKIGDKYDYGIDVVDCDLCGVEMKFRRYEGISEEHVCDDCKRKEQEKRLIEENEMPVVEQLSWFRKVFSSFSRSKNPEIEGAGTYRKLKVD